MIQRLRTHFFKLFVLNIIAMLFFLGTTVTGLSIMNINIHNPSVSRLGIKGNEFQIVIYVLGIIATLLIGMLYIYSTSRLIDAYSLIRKNGKHRKKTRK